MKLLALIIIGVYSAAMSFIFLYSLMQFSLALAYRRRKVQPLPENPDFLPKVLIQLPIYNEKYVVERLIDCVAQMDYPKDLLSIQILDDSNDETTVLAEQKAALYRSEGLSIEVVRRPNREGFKAGALAYGMDITDAEFIAIFDADFLPESDFLRKSIPFFQDEKLAAVQARWAHINESFNLLTKLQAFVLNAHFSIEQGGRNAAGHYINFNGTAGVWRKAAIIDAGGWQSDTLTEDLDLSYRAQLKNWKMKFLETLSSPAELPIEMNALRTQQFRWNKGAAECTRKNLFSVLRKSDIRKSTKLHALFHLMNSFLFICVLSIGLLSFPVVWALSAFESFAILYRFGSVFILSLFALSYFYWLSFKRFEPNADILQFIQKFLLFLAFSLGLSLHNGLAVLEGYLGIKTPFLRTPKFNVLKQKSSLSRNVYVKSERPFLAYIEVLLLCYFLAGIAFSIYVGHYGQLPFLVLLSTGYAGIVFYSFKTIASNAPEVSL